MVNIKQENAATEPSSQLGKGFVAAFLRVLPLEVPETGLEPVSP